jgi:RNA polymerase sigma-70 factor (ECF subfamily)
LTANRDTLFIFFMDEEKLYIGAGPTALNINAALEAERLRLFGYVRSVVRDGAIADDLTQEAMLRAHQGIAGLKDPHRLVPWLYRIATNACRDYFRKLHGTGRGGQGNDFMAETQDLRDENAPQLQKVMECAEMGECVRRYLEEVPDSYRTVIILHDLEGMTNPEIAAMLRISLATAKIRLHRARKHLREILEDACDFFTDERGILVCEPKRNKVQC